MAAVELLYLALDERLRVCYLLLDPLRVSGQQFPGLVVLLWKSAHSAHGEKGGEEEEEEEEAGLTSFGSHFVRRNCAMASMLECRIRIWIITFRVHLHQG